jgi:hypothetical protein
MTEAVMQTPDLMSLQEMIQENLPQVECNFYHHFSYGVYARERFAKAGTLIIGKRHRYQTLTILLEGDLSVFDGKNVYHYRAPYIFNSLPGEKRMTYSHTPTRLLTIHPTHETDLAKIEEEFIIPEQKGETP